MELDTRYFIAECENSEFEGASAIAKYSEQDDVYIVEIFSEDGASLTRKVISDKSSLSSFIKGKLIEYTPQVEYAIKARKCYKEILELALKIRKKDRKTLLGEEIVKLLEQEFSIDNAESKPNYFVDSDIALPIIRTNDIVNDNSDIKNYCNQPIKMSLGNLEGKVEPEAAAMANEIRIDLS